MLKCSYLVYLLFSIVFVVAAFGQETQQPPLQVINLVDEKSDFKINLNLVAGPGMEKIKVGKTTEDKDITISGGGGVGLSAGLGYLFTPNFEADLNIGFQNSTLSEKVENAEGSFSKTVLTASLKYIFQVSTKGQINVGAGFGYYVPGDMDIDASEVPNGAHEITSYDPSTGFHFLAEYEGFFQLSSNLLSWNAGLQYTSVSFEASAFKRDGQSFDVSLLKEEYRNLNCNCVNLIGGIAIYL